jgi:hypothetical protein
MNEDVLNDLLEAAKIAGFKEKEESLKLEVLKPGLKTHTNKALPDGYSAVYLFDLNGTVLKVGHCGLNCSPCFQSRHYGFSFKSSLAIFLTKDSSMNHLYDKSSIKNWIKENTTRYNIYIPASYGNYFRTFAESFLVLKYKPKFELKRN